jgi:hypothetical protein
MARVARVRISKEFFEMFLRGEVNARPNTVVTTNAPKDLEVLGLGLPESVSGRYPHTLEIYVKSETFEDVPEGQEPPLIEPFQYHVDDLNYWQMEKS